MDRLHAIFEVALTPDADTVRVKTITVLRPDTRGRLVSLYIRLLCDGNKVQCDSMLLTILIAHYYEGDFARFAQGSVMQELTTHGYTIVEGNIDGSLHSGDIAQVLGGGEALRHHLERAAADPARDEPGDFVAFLSLFLPKMSAGLEATAARIRDSLRKYESAEVKFHRAEWVEDRAVRSLYPLLRGSFIAKLFIINRGLQISTGGGVDSIIASSVRRARYGGMLLVTTVLEHILRREGHLTAWHPLARTAAVRREVAAFSVAVQGLAKYGPYAPFSKLLEFREVGALEYGMFPTLAPVALGVAQAHGHTLAGVRIPDNMVRLVEAARAAEEKLKAAMWEEDMENEGVPETQRAILREFTASHNNCQTANRAETEEKKAVYLRELAERAAAAQSGGAAARPTSPPERDALQAQARGTALADLAAPDAGRDLRGRPLGAPPSPVSPYQNRPWDEHHQSISSSLPPTASSALRPLMSPAQFLPRGVISAFHPLPVPVPPSVTPIHSLTASEQRDEEIAREVAAYMDRNDNPAVPQQPPSFGQQVALPTPVHLSATTPDLDPPQDLLVARPVLATMGQRVTTPQSLSTPLSSILEDDDDGSQGGSGASSISASTVPSPVLGASAATGANHTATLTVSPQPQAPSPSLPPAAAGSLAACSIPLDPRLAALKTQLLNEVELVNPTLGVTPPVGADVSAANIGFVLPTFQEYVASGGAEGKLDFYDANEKQFLFQYWIAKDQFFDQLWPAKGSLKAGECVVDGITLNWQQISRDMRALMVTRHVRHVYASWIAQEDFSV